MTTRKRHPGAIRVPVTGHRGRVDVGACRDAIWEIAYVLGWESTFSPHAVEGMKVLEYLEDQHPWAVRLFSDGYNTGETEAGLVR